MVKTRGSNTSTTFYLLHSPTYKYFKIYHKCSVYTMALIHFIPSDFQVFDFYHFQESSLFLKEKQAKKKHS